jgi:hypothetical protein
LAEIAKNTNNFLMERDYIKKQVDELARMLSKIISDLMGQKAETPIGGIEAMSQVLKSQLDIDFQALMSISDNDFITILEKKLSTESINNIAKIMLIVADNTKKTNEETTILYSKCLLILEYLEKKEATYSFDRNLTIQKIKKQAVTII